ncbi:hypothetical protein OTU49_017369 [Cherax quadricarinatus]|uniref:C2H2-type domain-containing protein n=1 Tax=Cherax quadricarinatus TaxID=27406 RepID=A0AAW0Y4L7_CHEQU
MGATPGRGSPPSAPPGSHVRASWPVAPSRGLTITGQLATRSGRARRAKCECARSTACASVSLDTRASLTQHYTEHKKTPTPTHPPCTSHVHSCTAITYMH